MWVISHHIHRHVLLKLKRRDYTGQVQQGWKYWGPFWNSAFHTQPALSLRYAFAYTILSFYYINFSIISLEIFWLAFKNNFKYYSSIKTSRQISCFFLILPLHFLSLSCFCFSSWTAIFSRAWTTFYLSLLLQPQACIKFLINTWEVD